MKRINTVFFYRQNDLQNNKNSKDLLKSIDKSADMPYLNAFMQVYFTTFPNKNIDNFLYYSTNTSKPYIKKTPRKTITNNIMKIISSKLINQQEMGSLSTFEIFMSWLCSKKRVKVHSYDFEIEVEPNNLKINDYVVGANHVKLLVTKSLRNNQFVLRTKELHPCPPFIGVDIIVVSRSFSKSFEIIDKKDTQKVIKFNCDKISKNKTELFCEKWKKDNIPFATEEFIWIKIKKEYITCAAIWYQDGNKYPGQPRNIDNGIVICGHRHGNCIAILKTMFHDNYKICGHCNRKRIDVLNNDIQGFLTSKGIFVNRVEGLRIAKENNQLLEGNNHRGSILFSEDIY